jgi:hypothetical protein
VRRSAIGRRNSKQHNRLRPKRNSGTDGFVQGGFAME